MSGFLLGSTIRMLVLLGQCDLDMFFAAMTSLFGSVGVRSSIFVVVLLAAENGLLSFGLTLCLQMLYLQTFCLQTLCLQTFCLQTLCLQTFCLQTFCLQTLCLQTLFLRDSLLFLALHLRLKTFLSQSSALLLFALDGGNCCIGRSLRLLLFFYLGFADVFGCSEFGLAVAQ
jgi:hypothetical protein